MGIIYRIITKRAGIKMKLKRIVLTTLILFLSSKVVIAGEVVEILTKDLKDQSASEETVRLLFSNGLMKMSNSDESEMIFNASAQNMTIVSHADKSYIVMDQNTGSAIKSEMEKAMEQALAQVPPEQRAMVENMMKQKMAGMGVPQVPEMETPKTEMRQTSRSETINGYDCTFYEAYRDDQKEGEFCIASWSELDASDNIQNSFKSMSEFMEGFLDQFKEMAPIQMESNPFTYMKEIGGFPVLSIQYSNGEPTYQSTLSSITEQDIEDAAFQPPEDYKLQNMMGR